MVRNAARAFAAAVALVCALVPQRASGHEVAYATAAAPSHEAPPPPPPCEKDCFLLSDMTLRGPVTGTMAFEMRGVVRAKEDVKIPLFGPPSQVRLDDVTIDGTRAPIGFEDDHYFVVTAAKTFTLRGKITLGSDQMLSVAGPLPSLEARLSAGRLVEGDRLSGLRNTILHFDPMTEGAPAAKPAPMVFRLSRAIRFGRETTFVYRITASQSTDLGPLRLPLKYAEKVHDVQGSTGWAVEGGALVLPTVGHDADVTVTGTMAPSAQSARTFSPDERSTYEWWLVEADPEHRVAVGGEPKLVDAAQSPIPPTMPGARVFLVQRGQELEVDARSLVRGDVLAAVARTERRFVAVTGAGEVINDETIQYENNGLDHLMLTPSGKAMYLSTDGAATRILHTEAGATDVLVPAPAGPHVLRVQSLGSTRLAPLFGVLALPGSKHSLATSASDVTIGLPEHVRPVAFLGGDRLRSASSRADLVAIVVGIVVAWFAFKTHRTRALGSVVVAGLWFVSRDAFVFAAAGLFAAGGIFLASRFLRGNRLWLASAGSLVVALVVGRIAASGDGGAEASRDMFVETPTLPTPEASRASGDVGVSTRGGAESAGVTPVSLSFPTSDRYVHSTRQLVTRERPFTPRIVYVTHNLVALLHVVWVGFLAALVWAHRSRLVAAKAWLVARLARRPDPALAKEAPPF